MIHLLNDLEKNLHLLLWEHVWLPQQQQPDETLPEFQARAPHQYRPTLPQRTLFQPSVEQRQSAWIPISRVLPDNTYGNWPPVKIEWEIRGLPSIQKEPPSLPMEISTRDQHSDNPKPINEEDDIGQMYSGTWICYHLSLAAMVVSIPNQYQNIAKRPKEEQHHWHAACKEEMKSLKEWKVWDLVDLPEGRKPVGNCGVFTRKSDSWYKACLVAQGFTQAFGINYQDTFSPVACFEAFHKLMALTVLHDWKLEALDVKTVMWVDRLMSRSRILTLREVLTKRHSILKVRLRFGTRDKGTRSQSGRLWIHKTDTVIA